METFFKNINLGEVLKLKNLVDFDPGKVVSLILVQREDLSITVFAFEKGEGLSTHSAPGEALIYVIEGQGVVKIGADPNGKTVSEGDVVVMPANIPHSVAAPERFKMLLTVVKKTTEGPK
jgi:quercetin dioxygenase-like cupin family protein